MTTKDDLTSLDISVGRDDTDNGIHLGVDNEPFWRTHITPQGEVLTGPGTSPPSRTHVPLAGDWYSAAVGQAYHGGRRSAVYDSVSDTTYVALWDFGEQYVLAVNHTTGLVSERVKVGTYVTTVPRTDSHGAPVIHMDGNGYLHVVWFAHSSVMQWSKSTAPRSILGWTETTQPDVPVGTYPSLAYSNGALWCVYRTGPDLHSEVYPSHNHGGLIRLIDGAAAWSDMRPGAGLIDQTGYRTIGFPGDPNRTTDVYLPMVTPAPDGKLWITWTASLGTIHDDARSNVYVVVYDPVANTVAAPDGTALGTTVTWGEMVGSVQARIAVRAPDGVAAGPHRVQSPELVFVGATPTLVWLEADAASGADPLPSKVWSARWTGSAWTPVAVTPPSKMFALSAAYAVHVTNNGLDIFATRFDAASKNHFEVFRSVDGGVSFTTGAAVVAPNSVYGVSGVINSDERCPLFWSPLPLTASTPQTIYALLGRGHPLVTPWTPPAEGPLRLGGASFVGGSPSPTTVTTTANVEIPALAMVGCQVGIRPVAYYFFTDAQMFTATAAMIFRVWDGAVGGVELQMLRTYLIPVNGSQLVGASFSLDLTPGLHTLRVSVALSTVTGGPAGVVGRSNVRTSIRLVEE